MGGASSVISHENAAKLSAENAEILRQHEVELAQQKLSPIELHYALTLKHIELSTKQGPLTDVGEASKTKSRKNVAFLFIKPHANNEKTQKLVTDTLLEKGLFISREGEFSGEEIDRDMLIDQVGAQIVHAMRNFGQVTVLVYSIVKQYLLHIFKKFTHFLLMQHYYAIASKATILKPDQIPVPEAKFEEFFGVSYADALKNNQVYNALDAGKYLGEWH